MKINYSRYMDSITNSNINTFLNNWYQRKWQKFYNKYTEDFSNHNELWLVAYDKYAFKKEWELIKKEVDKKNPTQMHKIEYFFVSLPRKIKSWLCCGFKCRYDKEIKQWTWLENYHMMDKLCRYETWENVKINAWDKIRFKLITGYKFE